MKSYNNLNDTQKHVLREYASWKKSDTPVAYKLAQLTYWRKRAVLEGIEGLIL